jgi:hypothetical protein
MNMTFPLRHLAVAALAAVALTACRNDGQNPLATDDKAATLSSPGNGAGNSATGATGGTATTPAAGNGAATPGLTGADTTGTSAYGTTGSGSGARQSGATDMSGKPQPASQANTPPSR